VIGGLYWCSCDVAAGMRGVDREVRCAAGMKRNKMAKFMLRPAGRVWMIGPVVFVCGYKKLTTGSVLLLVLLERMLCDGLVEFPRQAKQLHLKSFDLKVKNFANHFWTGNLTLSLKISDF